MRHKIYTCVSLGVLFFMLIAAKEQCEIASLDIRESARKSVSEAEKREFHIANPEGFRFTIENPNGNIEIKGNDSNEISITATKQWSMKAKGIEVEALLKGMQSGVEMITYEQSDTALNVKVRRVKSGVITVFKRIEFRVDFEVSVPRELKEIRIHSSNGNTVIENTHCNLEIESTNGEVKTDIEGKKTKISLVNGDISATQRGGEISISNVNGDIISTLNSSQGGEIALVNGDIEATITNPQDLKITASTLSGDIDFTGLETMSKSDKKVIGIIGKPDKELKIHATNGNIKIKVETDAL